VTFERAEAAYAVLHLGTHDFRCGIRMTPPPPWYDRTKKDLGYAFAGQEPGAAEQLLGEQFRGSLYGLSDVFLKERRQILELLTEERLRRVEGVYRELYDESRPLLAFMRASDVPVPPAFLVPAQYTLTRKLVGELRLATHEPISERAFEIARDLSALGVSAQAPDVEPPLQDALEARAQALPADPLGGDLDEVHRLLDLTEALGIAPALWRVQNSYYAAALGHRNDVLRGPEAASGRTTEFWRLGVRLSFNLDRLRAPEHPPEGA
jgi:hypothetical protein